MSVKLGLDVLWDSRFSGLKNKNIAVLCNQASVNGGLQQILSLMLPLHKNKQFNIRAVFGPQHGLRGFTQDNMIEWEGYRDSRTGLQIYSLYGEHRKPTTQMLDGVDLMVIDLPDIGSRYYTFVWTMVLCMEACCRQNIPVMILDRPNPISGSRVEGTVLQPDFSSFVGLYPLPQRHGMTIGEIARYIRGEYFSQLDLKIVDMQGWHRDFYFPDSGLLWVMPSPNMPTWETAMVYPGQCLLEATNISEGRGTTRPFEIFGAPWIDGRKLCHRVNSLGLPGVFFRPIFFAPTFHKYKGKLCQGGFLHVTDRNAFQPVLTTVALLQEIFRFYPHKFQWKRPPYEYEYHHLPIDILAGNQWLRSQIEEGTPLDHIQACLEQDVKTFLPVREKYLSY